jgi:tetratricopeptide (TPR) repeat protein
MRRAPAGAVLLGVVVIGSVAAQAGGDDKPKLLKLDSLSPALLSKLVGRYLERDYKGNKDKAKVVEALAPLGGLDKVADALNYEYRGGKPRFVVNASSTPRPANAAEVEAALRDVLEHTFTQLAQRPETIGEESYSISKAEADTVKAALPDALRVIWQPGAKGAAPARPKDDTAKGAPPPVPKRASPAPSGGKWQLVVSGYGVDCCGAAVPTYRWSYQPANGGAGNGSAAADNVPISLDGLKATDAPKLFWRGYNLYWQGEYEAAWQRFDAAARLADDDARYWYYKALTELALGRDDDAAKSRQRGAELQVRARPSAEAIGRALERIQGPRRMWLREGLDNLTTRP